MNDLYWSPCRCKTKGPSCLYFGSWDLKAEEGDYPANTPDLSIEAMANLTTMTHLSPPCLLHGLHRRFEAKQIYSLSGKMLLSINPYEEVNGLYGEERARSYKSHINQEPHLFLTAQEAVDALMSTSKNQSILISGESGAGKTVATKCILLYLASSFSNESGLPHGRNHASLVLKANPLLELFGNAPTLRNHNSSRFGKYLRVGMDPVTGSLSSLSLTTYLLERSRLLHHLEGEGTFHIFDLLEGKERFNPLVECGESLDDLLASFGLDPPRMKEVLQGFQAFRAGSWASLASALKVPLETLEDAMRVKRLETREGTIETPLSKDQGKAGWEAAALWLYGKFFEGIVSKIREALLVEGSPCPTISLLDIFGFEVFDQANGFEQLCINFTNERIQTVFNHHIFVLEQAVYAAEGLDWSDVVFPTNLAIVEDLRRVLALSTEECLVPRGSDKGLASKVDRLATHGVFSSIQVSSSQRPQGLFEVHHYAGPVTYSTRDFCTKNRGEMPKRWKALMDQSAWVKEDLWLDLFGQTFAQPLDDGSLTKGLTKGLTNSRLETVLTKFSRNLSTLIQELEGTSLHFVRCLKPNETMSPWSFDPKRIEEQLAYCGVLEAIRIARAGYPIRYLHEDFAKRFAMIPKAILDAMPLKRGHTKIFLKNETSLALEAQRRLSRTKAAISVQAFRRGLVVRRAYSALRAKTSILQGWWRAHLAHQAYLGFRRALCTCQVRHHYKRSLKAVYVLQGWCRAMDDRKRAIRARKRLGLLKTFVRLVTKRWKAKRVLRSFVRTSLRPHLRARLSYRGQVLARASRLLALWSVAVKLQRWWLVRRQIKTFETVEVQTETPETREIHIQTDETWTTIFDSQESQDTKKENERLKVENTLLQREWVQVQESIHQMRGRLDPLLSQLAILREENRELKRMIRMGKV